MFAAVLALVAFVLVATVSPVNAQTATPGPGIPREVAERRAATISDLHYELSLTVPRDQKAPLSGDMTARFTLRDASTSGALASSKKSRQ